MTLTLVFDNEKNLEWEQRLNAALYRFHDIYFLMKYKR